MKKVFFILAISASYISQAQSFGSCFNNPAKYAAGSGPACFALGDVNHDNIMDLAVANQNSYNVSILIGKADGTFDNAVNYSQGTQAPICITLGDFNNDNYPDIATASINKDTMAVMMNNGDGTFGAAVLYGTPHDAIAIACADFNNDNKKDLAVCTAADTIVNIYFGNGTGGFALANSTKVNANPQSVIATDFNNDGKQDLIVACNYSFIKILTGNGSGSFQPSQTFDVIDCAWRLAVADFNNDGRKDVASVCLNGLDVSVMLGNASGGLDTAYTYAIGGTQHKLRALAAADFNGDGKMDVAVSKGDSVNTVSLMMGDGNGHLSYFHSFPVAREPWAIHTYDFNGDGKIDIAATGRYADSISISTNNTAILNLAPIDTQQVSTSAVTLSGGSPAGGVYSGPFVNGGIFDPNAAGAGLYTITYAVTDANGCIDSARGTILVQGSTLVTKLSGGGFARLYPNPATASVSLFLSDYEHCMLEIYNVTGQKVLSQPLYGNITELDLSKHSNGLYKVNVLKDNTLIYQSSLIRQE